MIFVVKSVSGQEHFGAQGYPSASTAVKTAIALAAQGYVDVSIMAPTGAMYEHGEFRRLTANKPHSPAPPPFRLRPFI